MTEEEKKAITREKHPGRVAQGNKLAALMKKRKEEILREKEQFTVQSAEQPTVQSTVQSKLNLYLWRWYTCCPSHRRLRNFCT